MSITPSPSTIALNPFGVYDSPSGTVGSNKNTNTTLAIEDNIIFEGVVLDQNAKPIPGVNITFTQTPPSTETSPIIKSITENLVTNNKGEWSIIYPKTDINLKNVSIVLIKSKYNTETITNPQITSVYPSTEYDIIKVSTPEVEPPYEYRVGNEVFKSNDQNAAKSRAEEYHKKLKDPKYKKASVVNIKKKLTPIPDENEALKNLIQPILNDITQTELKQINQNIRNLVPPLVRIANLVSIGKEQLKAQLIPFILKLLLPFGFPVVQAIVNKVPIDQIKNQILCLKKDKILELIKKRNKVINQINKLYKTVSTLSTLVTTFDLVSVALKAGVIGISIIPFPMPPAIPFAITKLEELLKRFGVIINTLTLTLASFGAALGYILNLTNSLDALLQICSQDLNKDENIFVAINDELNLLINDSTGIDNKVLLDKPQVYKGFTLELILDPYNPIIYPKRFAQALTRNGVPVLKTDSSFASEPQVLLDQLKFLIDLNPDLTAG